MRTTCLSVFHYIFFFIKKSGSSQKAASNYATAEFHKGQDGTIAIENPGYAPSESGSVRSARRKEEQPYSNVIHAGLVFYKIIIALFQSYVSNLKIITI